MTDNNKNIPEGAQSNALTDDQLAEVVGGMMDTLNVSIIHSKRCVDDPSHVYALRFNACPICGCREYTCD